MSVHFVRKGIYGLLIWAACLCGASLRGQSNGLVLDLIVPISNPQGQREISLARYPRLYAQLSNLSPQNIRIWKDWNSWGWFNLSLRMHTSGGDTLVRRRSPGRWEGDFPDFWTLEPGESVILEIDMRKAQWEGLPDLYGEKLTAILTAVYENKPDVLSEEYQIWTGAIYSRSLEVIFY